MSKNKMRSLSRVLLASIVTLFALSASPARASLYAGEWDPAFGSPFINLNPPINWSLDWSGNYFVNADCPAVGSGTLATCTPPSASVFSASVTLSRPGGGSTTINFLPSSFVIQDLFYQNDVITKLKTDLSTFMAAPLSGDPLLDAALAPWTFALNFVMDGQAASSGDVPPIVPPALPNTYSGPVLFAATSLIPNTVTIARSDVVGNPPVFTGLFRVRDVPEPGTLALFAGALLSAGLLRSRMSGKSRR